MTTVNVAAVVANDFVVVNFLRLGNFGAAVILKIGRNNSKNRDFFFNVKKQSYKNFHVKFFALKEWTSPFPHKKTPT